MTFKLGDVVATRGSLAVMAELDINPLTLISRHLQCDWKEMEPEDQKSNREAIDSGEARIFSAYTYGTHKFWVITEWDRSVTTILLPDEY